MAAASEMDFIFLVVSRLEQAPLIDCGCLHTFLYPLQAGAPRTHASAPRPIPTRKTCCDRRGRCGAAASGAQVCRSTVCPECATPLKRTALKRLRQLRSAAHARLIRLVNVAAGGKIGSVLASVIGATQANLLLPDQVNHQFPGARGPRVLGDPAFPCALFLF
jgi:hypothetical protein